MLNSILGPIARDGLKKRDRVYVGNFVTIPLEPGEERVASWMVRDVPEGVSWYKANAAVAGNLILTSKRLLFEPHVPPMMAYGAHGKKTGFNLLQRSNTRGHRYEPLAVELADVRSVEADHVDDLQGAGAPVKIVMEDGGERRLRIVRELPAPAPRAGVGEQARSRGPRRRAGAALGRHCPRADRRPAVQGFVDATPEALVGDHRLAGFDQVEQRLMLVLVRGHKRVGGR